MLKKHPRHFGCNWVFWRRKGQRIKWPLYAYYKVIKAAGIRRLRLHDLRHSFASHLVMSGVDLSTVQELMGHKSISMTQVYAHLTPEHKAHAVEKLKFNTDVTKMSPAKNMDI